MKKLSILILLAFMLQFACSPSEDITITKKDKMSTDVPERIIAKLQQAGFFTDEGLSRAGDSYIVEYDIRLTERAIDEMLVSVPKTHKGRTEHYRANNLVSIGGARRTINVYMDPSFVSPIQAAFDAALVRYNNENLALRFQRTFNSNAADTRIVPFYQVSSKLGDSDFAASGNPGPQIRLNTYYYNNTPRADAVTTIAHELGHAIGFRHTDYMNRGYSCDENENEGASLEGVNHIPGTPTTPVANSWMLACNLYAVDRPFTPDDRVALRALYSLPPSILLTNGQSLGSNQSVTTSDGQYTLVMQGDGNLVTYRGSQPIWSSNTPGTPINQCVMQSDGNLVLYGSGVPYWHTDTYMYPGGYLTIANDVLSIIQNGVIRWSSGPSVPPPGNHILASGQNLAVGDTRVSQDGRFTLVLQSDGNLVLYQGSTPLWASGTNGLPVTRCSMQTDGNLVLYSSNGTPYWHTNTAIYPGAQLQVGNDGNLKIIQNNITRWSSNTCCH